MAPKDKKTGSLDLPGFNEGIQIGLRLEKPHHLGHRDRLRQRFKAASDALADYELLELLLFRVIPRTDTKPIAKSLLTRFGSLAEVLGAPEKLIAETPGVGPSIALELKIVEAIAKRSARSMVMEREVLGSWSQVIAYCTTAMAYETREQFRVLFLDKKKSPHCRRSAATGNGRSHASLSARGRTTSTGAFCNRDNRRSQSSVWRSDTIAG